MAATVRWSWLGAREGIGYTTGLAFSLLFCSVIIENYQMNANDIQATQKVAYLISLP